MAKSAAWLRTGVLASVLWLACSDGECNVPLRVGRTRMRAGFRAAPARWARAAPQRSRRTPRRREARGGGRTPAQADAGRDAAAGSPGRAFLLASAGTQLLVDGPSLGLQLTEANLADDVDVVAVHQEFYGVPWQAFLDGSAPPAEWSAKMQALAQHAHGVSDRVFLSISMLDGARESLAERTRIEDGQPKGEDGWAARCYDFASAPDGARDACGLPALRGPHARGVHAELPQLRGRGEPVLREVPRRRGRRDRRRERRLRRRQGQAARS